MFPFHFLYRGLVLILNQSFKINEQSALVRKYIEELRLLNVKLYFIMVRGLRVGQLGIIDEQMKAANTFPIPSLTSLANDDVQALISDRIGNNLKGET